MRIAQFRNESVRFELLGLLKAHAYAKRNVTLASGQKSDFYIDCKKISFRADGTKALGQLFFEAMIQIQNESIGDFEACGGMALGAVPLAISLTLEALAKGQILHSVCVRKSQKDHGTCSTIEGSSLQKGARILLVEDVITTGGSTINAALALRSSGYVVENVIAIVDREAHGEDNLKANGLSLYSLFNLSDFRN